MATDTEARRARSRRGEGDRLRVELLDAAAELMAEHGSLDKVGVRAVAGEVGVSPAAVYRHFEDLDDLLWSSVSHCWAEFRGVLAEASASSPDPYERFAASGAAYLRFAMEQPGKYRVLFSNRVPLPPRTDPLPVEAFDHLVGLVGELLADRRDDRDPHFVACQVHAVIHGLVDLIGGNRHVAWPDINELLDDAIVRLGLVDAGTSTRTAGR